MPKRIVVLLVSALALHASVARAELQEKTGTFAGMAVTYKVVLPNGYDASRAYPGVLVFSGGDQTLQGTTGTVQTDWQQEAERRGYIVIAPAAPNGRLFFQTGDRIFPEFLEFILKTYKISGKLHIAGHSNGGLSAFHIAAKYPQYFSTLTGYPGLLDGQDLTRAAAIKSMCIFMHVGEEDDGWQGAMSEQAMVLRGQRYKVQFTIEPKQMHRIRAAEVNLSPRLFDEIESCR